MTFVPFGEIGLKWRFFWSERGKIASEKFGQQGIIRGKVGRADPEQRYPEKQGLKHDYLETA